MTMGGGALSPSRLAASLVGVFTLSVFISAALLFSVQPLFTKMALPLLGGAPNVWNTAMVFFQGCLLAGYLYAHLLAKYLTLKFQVGLHVLITGIGLLFLPFAISTEMTSMAGEAHALWLIGLYGTAIGMPFFALSANAPLLQHWFSKTSHKDADDPYFLYAASNVGSLLVLALYPLVFEPSLTLTSQASLWSFWYVVMISGLIICGIFGARFVSAATDGPEKDKIASVSVSWGERSLWMFLAFIPSSLMLGLTTYLTTNLAAVPFLWILPLAAYLLTFVIVFAKSPRIGTHQLKCIFPWAVIAMIWASLLLKKYILFLIAGTLPFYFIIALMCHARLAEERPAASQLTTFYIWMSAGGFLGGMFNALLAPVIFNDTYEYFIVLFIASFALLESGEVNRNKFKQIGLVSIGFVIAYAIMRGVQTALNHTAATFMLPGIFVFFLFLKKARPEDKFEFPNFMLAAALLFIIPNDSMRNILQDRSFFGVMTVSSLPSEYGDVHRFSHGDTIHNYQFQDPKLRRVPLAYYAEHGAFGKTIKAVRGGRPKLEVVQIGLGAGAMACYKQPGEKWVFLEIDQAIISMAQNSEYFSYLETCAPKAAVKLGDARLTIKDIPQDSVDLIMVDAFSSDAIPVHLVTTEALLLYRSRLKEGGFVFYHTSNRLIDISSVVTEVARAQGLSAKLIYSALDDDVLYKDYLSASEGVLVGRPEDMQNLDLSDPDWLAYTDYPFAKTWTDDYSSILGPILSMNGKRARLNKIKNAGKITEVELPAEE